MTAEEAKFLLANWKVPLVRLNPNSNTGKEGSQHFGRAQLLGVRGDKAIVKPFGHGKEELVSLKYVNKWSAQTPEHLRDKPLAVPIKDLVGDKPPPKAPEKRIYNQTVDVPNIPDTSKLLAIEGIVSHE